MKNLLWHKTVVRGFFSVIVSLLYLSVKLHIRYANYSVISALAYGKSDILRGGFRHIYICNIVAAVVSFVKHSPVLAVSAYGNGEVAVVFVGVFFVYSRMLQYIA